MILGYVYDKAYQNYAQVFKRINDIEQYDNDKPIIIVGWKVAKELYPTDFSVNNWKIKDNVYWTCSSDRDKVQFDENFENFINICIQYQISSFDYRYFDLMLEDLNTLDFSEYESVLYLSNFIYIRGKQSIVGISLELANSLGFDLFNDPKIRKLKNHEIQPSFSQQKGYKIMCF